VICYYCCLVAWLGLHLLGLSLELANNFLLLSDRDFDFDFDLDLD
jgi:hypothetical protein